MARKRRFIQSGFCYHVMLRGNGGQDIFTDTSDCVRFCLLLQYASEKHQLNIHSFCLMKNHVHFVVQPCTAKLTAGMHALAFRYAQYFNKKYKRRGYLYQGRYKAVLVQSGTYFRRLVRYVHLNPVRAGIIQRPEEYLWSSYRAYIGKDSYAWLNRDLVLDSFGGESESSVQRLSNYTQMNDDEARNEVIEIRKSVHKGAYGDSEFLEKWRPILVGDAVKTGTYLKTPNEVSVESIVEIVCSRLNSTLESICSDKRTEPLVLARMIMANLTQQLRAGSMTALGRHIARDPTSLAKLAKKAEANFQAQAITQELLKLLVSGET